MHIWKHERAWLTPQLEKSTFNQSWGARCPSRVHLAQPWDVSRPSPLMRSFQSTPTHNTSVSSALLKALAWQSEIAPFRQWSINNHSSVNSPRQHKTEDKEIVLWGICFYSLLPTDQEDRSSLNGLGFHGSLQYLPASQLQSNEQIKLLLLWKEPQSSEGALCSRLTWRRVSRGLPEPRGCTNLSVF